MAQQLEVALEPGQEASALQDFLHSPQQFREIYYRRQVNTLYFDLPHFGDYVSQLQRAPLEVSYRLRWAGKLKEPAQAPRLQAKFQGQNQVNSQDNLQSNSQADSQENLQDNLRSDDQLVLPGFTLNSVEMPRYFASLRQDVQDQAPWFSPQNLSLLQGLFARTPVLITWVQRRYFQSENREILLYLDQNPRKKAYLPCCTALSQEELEQGPPQPSLLILGHQGPQNPEDSPLTQLLQDLAYQPRPHQPYVAGLQGLFSPGQKKKR